ncbi:MAG TPA: peptidase M54 [Vicinamibacteria bacterium]
MITVGLLPLGAPPEEVLDGLAAGLREAFGMPTRRVPGLVDPPDAFDGDREQWSAVVMLRALLERPATEGGRLLGVTERDLFVPVLSFVYGQAQLRGRVAVISLARLRPEFHGLRPDPALVAQRAVKEAVHEVGHTFGLVHCLDRRCPMALSLGLDDLDYKTAAPCASCAALLAESLDMPERAPGTTRRRGNP